jgi:hypothetical protein
MPFLDFGGREAYDAPMMPRALIAIVLLAAVAGSVQAQSLAEVARAEAARRQTVNAPAKVYTNDDLRPDFSKGTPPPATGGATAPADTVAGETVAAPTGSPSAGAAAPDVKDQAYWSSRMSEARANVQRSQAFAQALQNRIDMLWTDFVNRGDPVQQRAIEQDRNKALAELESLKKEIEANQKAVAAVEDEARRAGVPAGWLRP